MTIDPEDERSCVPAAFRHVIRRLLGQIAAQDRREAV